LGNKFIDYLVYRSVHDDTGVHFPVVAEQKALFFWHQGTSVCFISPEYINTQKVGFFESKMSEARIYGVDLYFELFAEKVDDFGFDFLGEALRTAHPYDSVVSVSDVV
jgi:hypothetical protein